MSAKRQQPLLSVVVPMYNVVLFLDECLESLLHQNLNPNELEVIMVNDGATDGTALIAEKWAKRHKNYHLINQKNGGLSAARNTGIKYATGKYITFCDSDDIIPKNSYKERLEIIEKTGSDFITGAVFRFNRYIENAREWRVEVLMSDIQKASLATHPEFLSDAVPWNKIYNRKFFMKSGVLFPVGRIYEDIATTPKLYHKAKSFDVYSKPTYYWRVTKGSISNSQTLKHHEDRLWAVSQSLQYFQQAQVNNAIMSEFDFFIIDYNLRWILLDLYKYDRQTRMDLYAEIQRIVKGIDSKTLTRIYQPLNKWIAQLQNNELEELDADLSKQQFIVNNVKNEESKTDYYKRLLKVKYRLLKSFVRDTKNMVKRRFVKFYIYYFLRPILIRLPLKSHTAVFSSYWGREFSLSDAPPSICVELAKHSDYECVVIATKESEKRIRNNLKTLIGNDHGVKVIKANSFGFHYYLWTAKYLFNDVNFGLGIYTRNGFKFAGKRSGQVEIQTTHGTPLKKLGLDSDLAIRPSEKLPFIEKTKRYDYLIASSRKVADIVSGAFHTKAKILKTGLPQNDFLFHEYDDEYKAKIKQKYGIDQKKKIVLYTPTFRYDKGYAFRYLMDIEAMSKKLDKDYQIIIKMHPFNHTNVQLIDFESLTDLKSKKPFIRLYGEVRQPKNINLPLDAPYTDRWDVKRVDADINELLLIADVLVLDYSSIMFNSSHLDIPTIFFTPDIDFYNGTRGLYFNIDEIAPGSVAKNTEDLINDILQSSDKVAWSKRYGKKIRKFKKDFTEWENGNAARKVLEELGILSK